MKRKLLFLDLDGTLLTDDKQISNRNSLALRKLIAAGNGVVITTGRPLVSAMEQARHIGQDTPGCYLICYNGGQVYDWGRGEIIASQILTKADAVKIFDYCNAQNFHIQTYDRDRVLVEPRCDDAIVREYCRRIHMEYKVIRDVRTSLNADPVKCLAIEFEHPERLRIIEDWLKENAADRIDTFYSCDEYLEIVPAGVSKGSALKQMCRLLDADIADTVAAGDAANDLSMIEAAGVGVAMANGTEEAKARADYVTKHDNNHDGIAEVAERFFKI